MQRSGRVFLTGATGFLGSHLTAEFLKRGFSLTLLARPQGGMTAGERVARILSWLCIDRDAIEKLEILEGHIDQPHLSATGAAPFSPACSCDEIVHCASDTSFSERKRARVERANIRGLENLLEFAARSGRPHFHYLSTAYVAGKREGLCREQLEENGSFHNVYEESKYRAERLVAERCRALGIQFSIYRPSIVYGDSRTGRTMRFNALYYPIRTVAFLRNLYESDIRERGGAHASAAGVRQTAGGLFMPIRVETVRHGGLNLIPIDYFVQAFMVLKEMRVDGGVFHLVNPRLVFIEELISLIESYFGIEGLEAVFDGAPLHPRNPLEALFDSYAEVYAPYMSDTRAFEDEKTRRILGGAGIECPDFDYGVFKRCMDYALEVDWGRKLPL